MNPAIPSVPADSAQAPWRVLVVDDDADVQSVTRLALGSLQVDGRDLEIIPAMSGAEARRIWRETPDIALVLLDVVMESDDAGLQFVRFVRDEACDPYVRLVLRTGQPGQAPAFDSVMRYEIDDYREKTSLTYDQLKILAVTTLRTYGLLRQVEARRVQAEKSNRELEQYAYFVSHDLQSPLRSIVSFAQMLGSRLEDRIAPGERELLDFVISSGQHMHGLTQDLLHYSRLGRLPPPMAEVALDDVLVDALKSMHGAVAKREAKVECGPMPVVPGNHVQLAQLFANLIENAIKFQPGPAPTVKIEASEHAGEWEIRVADHGIGIAAEYLTMIFEPFKRLHTLEQYPGSGIGLAICKRVAELHGGRIRAESSKEQGTSIILTLPKRLSQVS